MATVDLVAEHVCIKQLPDVFLLVVARHLVTFGRESLANLRQLPVDALLLQVLGGAVPDVGNEHL